METFVNERYTCQYVPIAMRGTNPPPPSLSTSVCNLSLLPPAADLQHKVRLADGERHQILNTWLHGLVYITADKVLASTVVRMQLTASTQYVPYRACENRLGAGSKLHSDKVEHYRCLGFV